MLLLQKLITITFLQLFITVYELIIIYFLVSFYYPYIYKIRSIDYLLLISNF